MVKLFYAIEIFLFRDQRDAFNLTKKGEAQLQQFVQYGALLYTKAWTEASLAADIPGNDMALWTNFDKYQAIDRDIGIAAKTVLERHLWYLLNESVG